jgi:hypothetical protein
MEDEHASRIILTRTEIELLTDLVLPRCQVNELQKRDFWRARLVHGKCILERAHYEAVCAGARPPNEFEDRPRPRVLP